MFWSVVHKVFVRWKIVTVPFHAPQELHCMMNEKQIKHSRPLTVWVGKSSFCHEELSSKSTASPDIKPSPSHTMSAPAIAPGSTKLRPNSPEARISRLNQNPWDTFEPVAGSKDQSLIFARHRKKRGHLVHTQRIEQQFSFAATSSCSIIDDEIVAIVKPVLEGIQYLRRLGRALATLSPETILFTQSGDVKIKGVENSCQIEESEMNPATMKLCALGDIVTKLMLKNRTYEWEPEIQNLPRQLESVSIEELLQNEMFTRKSCEGELKLLVSIANKTAYHGIKSYYARC
ncbi:hypothetical protein PENARI_c129G10115 [Penicillium arizonense]|uniref:Uncharacterized protein n=1 Tax=Penicillium arizonense TaxID=1835702 RepID=A0A1F5L105_PENAI|nr:hypothetical protein PENARI_c129G10115 [Penicillium arizonense]OGE46717.1 hypothetical protein PENARI_c129G10115 [Penicillium arizonense]